MRIDGLSLRGRGKMTEIDPYRTNDKPVRPRFRIVQVPIIECYIDLQSVIDKLEEDERIVSVYPVRANHVGSLLPFEALIEVVNFPS